MVSWTPTPVGSYPALLAPVTLAASWAVEDMDGAAVGHRPCRGQWPK